jgi:DNA-binding HxlR family transcriptional regulator
MRLLCFALLRISQQAYNVVAFLSEALHAMPTPVPGKKVRGSTTGEPIMALLDLLGRRWALRVIWELRADTLNFRQLQERCAGMSSSVLNARLAELREAGIVERAGEGYRLSDEGRLLMDAYPPLGAWAERWARRAGASRPAGR